jgi:hypothetical protein
MSVRPLVALCWFLAFFSIPHSPAFAQIASTAPGPAVSAPGALSRFRFHLGAVRVTVDDPRFRWDADLGGDIDLVDWGGGRVTFLANYEVVLGDERRAFEPVHGNYTLDLSGSVRTTYGEFMGLFHHVSRHLSDRSKPEPVDWNMVGVRFMTPFSRGRLSATGAAHALWTVQHSFVDYDAEYGVEGRLDYELGGRRTVFTGGALHLFKTDPSVGGRERQAGARLEGGVRLAGRAAAVELIAAVERRVDDDPLRFSVRPWGFFGFRLVHP